MDKIKVNNQVILMRKYVKQAKLFAINKLTKLVKTYQNKKGTEEQKLKNERKVKRCFEKIAILKKIKPDSVSRMALSKAKDWNAILAQKNAPLEEQCLATLANCSEVQKEVEKFYSSESHLVQKIPELIQEWEIKNQNPDNKTMNALKASDIKRKKLEKISKRKKSQFKGASFPNNVKIAGKSHGSDGKKILSNNENFCEIKKFKNDASEQVRNEVLKVKVSELPKADKSLDITMEQKSLVEVNNIPPNETFQTKFEKANGKIKEKRLRKVSQKHPHNALMDNMKNNPNTNQSIFEKLNAIAASDSKTTSKHNGSKNTKAVTAFEENLLENSTEISVDASDDIPVSHKKDSFFLTGEESNDDSNRGVEQPFRYLKLENQQNKYKKNNFEDKIFRNQKKKFPDKAFSSNKTHFKQGNTTEFGFSARRNKGNSFKPFSHQSKEFKSTDNRNLGFAMNNKNNVFKKESKKQKLSPEKHGDTTNLHPSWEAKRKLKEFLNSGKKATRIVFND